MDLHRRPRRGQRDHEPDEDQQVGAAAPRPRRAGRRRRAARPPRRPAPARARCPAAARRTRRPAPATTTQPRRIRPRGNSFTAFDDGEDERGGSDHERDERGQSAGHRISSPVMPLARGRRARRPRGLRRGRSHAHAGARPGDEPALERRRLLAPLAALRGAARRRRRADRSPGRGHGPRLAGGHGDRGQPRRSSRSGAGAVPTGSPRRSRSRATCRCRPRGRSHPATPPPRSRSRPGSATCRRRPPPRCARSPRRSAIRAFTPVCTTPATCWPAP